MIVIVQDFATTGDRRKEFDFCLTKTLENPGVTSVIDISESAGLPEIAGIQRKPLLRRATFADFIEAANKLPSNTQVCLLNLDCYLGEGWENLNLPESTVFCIGRHEHAQVPFVNKRLAELHHAHSQDAWVFRTPLKVDLAKLDFPMGMPGVDNAFAHRMQQAGYAVRNPMYALKVVHVDARSSENPYAHRDKAGPRPELEGSVLVPALGNDGSYVEAIGSLVAKLPLWLQEKLAFQLYNQYIQIKN